MDYETMWRELKEQVLKGQFNIRECRQNSNPDSDERIRLAGKVEGVDLVAGWIVDIEKQFL